MSNPIVKIKEGELKGVETINTNGTKYYAFTGIPYAEPPVGKLRFKDPIPKEPWTGVKDATKIGNVSPQCELVNWNYIGNEDCLFINVYTTKLPSENEKPMPVMLYIHGGAFVRGSGTEDGPEYLIEEGIVFVSFNYRLGIMGFLCTDSKNARGDMGLKDQNLALKWVKQNISVFNGDPDNVTLFGISSGSAAVEYHMISKYSRGLFHKAILQSCSCITPCSRTRNGIEKALRVAKSLGYKKGDLFEFINRIPANVLVLKSMLLWNEDDIRQGVHFLFTPVINELEGYDGFIKGEPLDLFKNGEFEKIPVISGICEKEAMLTKVFYSGGSLADLNNGKFDNCMPNYLVNDREELKRKLKIVYNGNVQDFLSDVYINGANWFSRELRMKYNQNNEYSYVFSYDGRLNLLKKISNVVEKGATHIDDSGYLFSSKYINRNDAKPNDLIVSSRMIKMWTNFAKTSDPTPTISGVVNEKWIPYSKETKKYMDIGESLKLKENLWPERMQLWNDIYTHQK